jgi:8-oxo-dGTP diphosphatase
MKKNLKTPDPGSSEAGFLPGLAIDTVIFGFHEKQLRILILEYRNTGLFALPGGFIKENEDLDAAALRILCERTGLSDVYLEQFYVFGNHSRHDPSPMRTILKKNKIKISTDHWLLKRFVSVGYYALIDFTKAVPRPDFMSDRCEWYDMKHLPPPDAGSRKNCTKSIGHSKAQPRPSADRFQPVTGNVYDFGFAVFVRNDPG